MRKGRHIRKVDVEERLTQQYDVSIPYYHILSSVHK